MFDFRNANKEQKRAITTTEGPVLITAGPGTGKTFTLVKRALYLIQEKGVKPEQIMLVTFTEKAAKELVTRMTNEMEKMGIRANLNEMYVGTFHSICLRIIKENVDFTRLKKNYRMLDGFDQIYTIYQNIFKFSTLEGFGEVVPDKNWWGQARAIAGLVNPLSEELVDADKMMKDKDPKMATLGNILKTYKKMLSDENMLDFAAIQTELYRLLTDKRHPEILEELQEKLRYIMVDEYQDTNFIQQKIVFLLGAKHNNICVVGDDDQGLYRFRGATIRNILEFPRHGQFASCGCKDVHLVVNYRSHSDIVNFYNEWMSATHWNKKEGFEWGDFRFPKQIVPGPKANPNWGPAVLKTQITVEDGDKKPEKREKWRREVLAFIKKLQASGKLEDLNQIAFLFKSVKNPEVVELAEYLESNGIKVYSPRSERFFQRDEIRYLVGCLILLFPKYEEGLKTEAYDYLDDDYFNGCVAVTKKMLAEPGNAELKQWIAERGRLHAAMKKTTDYGYVGLIYQMFRFAPFSNVLGTNMGGGVTDTMPARNLAEFTKIIGNFEYLYGIDVLNPKMNKGGKLRVDADTETLFNKYLSQRISEGITEYEDEAEYAPSGCVSFLTIHQSKGLEFPIVVVDLPLREGRDNRNLLLETAEDKFFERPAFEPRKEIKHFDFWRLYYTAFSRAQDLLVLSCRGENPAKFFQKLYAGIDDVNSRVFKPKSFEFSRVKDVNLKKTFSFTSHISVYEECPTQYKFYKELGFTPVRVGAMLFGTLVHQTIEDMHKAAIRGEEGSITKGNIEKWFDANYTSLSQMEHSYLGENQKKAALEQVLKYAERQSGKWEEVRKAEVDVSLVKQNYIIEGKVDLIKGKGNTVEIVDFKSEKKPDLSADPARKEKYKRQLELYAHLVQERTGHKVSQMHLYYTGDESGDPMITFPFKNKDIDRAVREIGETVRKILKKQFSQKCQSKKTCGECDFRYYCKRTP